MIRPLFDEVTVITHAFAGEILSWLQGQGIDFLDLEGVDATRPRVEAVIRDNPEAQICFYDHGDKAGLVQQGGKGFVLDLANCPLLDGKEVYTTACLAARGLGKEVCRRGGMFWGYTDVFILTTDAINEFQQAANCGFRYRHIDGEEPEAALARAKKKMEHLCQWLIDSGRVLAAVSMRHDRDCLSYCDTGKKKAGPLCKLVGQLRRMLH